MTPSILANYDPAGFYCEMLRNAANEPIRNRLAALSIDALKLRAAKAEAGLFDQGVTFTVYSDKPAIDRILPFDVIPRVLSAADWRSLESGVMQRVTALNLLLDDLYHEQKLLKDGIVPADLLLGNANYRTLCRA